jgi:glycopeptide antibiotics resistance protein
VIVLVALAAVPLAVAFAVWLARRRVRAGVEPGWARRSAYAEVLMVVGTVPWLWMTMTPNHNWYRGGNIVPLRDLMHEFQVGTVYALIQITGNLAVFAALGFGMPIRWRVGPAAVLLVAAAGSTTIETLQWVLDLHRYSSIDDVIVNTAGAVAAAWVARPWWRSRLRVPTKEPELAAANAPDVTGG